VDAVEGRAASDPGPLADAWLLRIVAIHAVRRRAAARGARRDDPVWLNNQARPLTPAALDHLVRRWFARAGADAVGGGDGSCHNCRRVISV
jgi:hypothetical protein